MTDSLITQIRDDIARMRTELTQLRSRVDRMLRLRKRVLFYCHPDRGGDEALARELNFLFDELEGV